MDTGLKERVQYIDVAKGIGIILMIAGHIWGGWFQAWIYSFHMPLFFICSGITFSIDLNLRRCINKALYPYITLSFLCLLYLLAIQILQGPLEFQSLLIEILSFVLFWGIGNLWFIPCITLSKIIFAFSYRIKPWLPLLVSIIAVLIICFYYPAGNSYRSLDTVLLKSLVGVIFIAVGYYAKQLVSFLQKKRKMICLILIFSIISHFLLFYFSGYRLVDLNTINIGNPVFYIFEAIIGSSSILIFSMIVQSNRFLGFVGKNSLLFLAINNFNIIVALSKKYFTFTNENLTNSLAFFLMLLFEVIIVMIINRFLPFIVSYPQKRNDIIF